MAIAEAPSGPAAAFDKVDVGLLPDDVAKLYLQLAREDLPVHQSANVAQGLPYITGETVRQVLNQVLGIHRWSFNIVSSEWDKDADHIITLGRLTVWIDGRELIHENYGGKQVIRSRSTGTPVNLGFDYKAAATEALKKCASDLGVGLWLSRKESAFWDAQEAGEPPKPGSGNTRSPSTGSRPATRANGSSVEGASVSASGSTSTGSSSGSGSGGASGLVCEVCGDAITGQPKELSDDAWDGPKLAKYGKDKYGHAVCWPHYRAFKAKAENKPLPRGAKAIPPEEQWAINQQQASANRPRPAPAPASASTSTATAKSGADYLAELKAGLQRKTDASPADQARDEDDPDQTNWVISIFYDVIGELAEPMIAYLFTGKPSIANVYAIEQWTNEDRSWAKRLELAAAGLPRSAAA